MSINGVMFRGRRYPQDPQDIETAQAHLSDAFFRALALIGAVLLLCSIPAQRDWLGEPYRSGHSSSCVLKQCPYPDKSVCLDMDVEPGGDACGAAEEFGRVALEAEIARFRREAR